MDAIDEESQKRHYKRGKKELALERVRLALERLQLAWLRTAITFVALGFTAYKAFYTRIEEGKEPLARNFSSIINGRSIAIFLIVVAFMGLFQATIQHRKNWTKLKVYYPAMSYSVALTQSYLILGFTFLLLLVVLFNL